MDLPWFENPPGYQFLHCLINSANGGDSSAVDGFAFINSNKMKRELRVIGESKPGQPFQGEVNKNQAIKVFTGAYLLKEITKIDTVCMEEDTITIGDKLKLGKSI